MAMLGGWQGRHLHALAHNRDPRRVERGRRRRSIGSQQALGWRRRSPAELDEVLAGLVDRVARRLRAGHRVARTVVLRLRFDDLTRIARSRTLPEPTDETLVLLVALRALLAAELERIRRDGITLLGVAVANLDDADAVQLALPFGGRDRRALDASVDAVRERFGSAAVGRTSSVGRRWSPEVPRLED